MERRCDTQDVLWMLLDSDDKQLIRAGGLQRHFEQRLDPAEDQLDE